MFKKVSQFRCPYFPFVREIGCGSFLLILASRHFSLNNLFFFYLVLEKKSSHLTKCFYIRSTKIKKHSNFTLVHRVLNRLMVFGHFVNAFLEMYIWMFLHQWSDLRVLAHKLHIMDPRLKEWCAKYSLDMLMYELFIYHSTKDS